MLAADLPPFFTGRFASCVHPCGALDAIARRLSACTLAGAILAGAPSVPGQHELQRTTLE